MLMTAPDPTLAPYLARASTLPAMPEVAHRLLASFEKDDLSLQALAQLIARDQALAGKVLRLANSARYAPSRNIASLGDAVATLGLRAVRDLTLAACVAGAFPAVPGFDRRVFWAGTLATAAYAQPLASLLGEDGDTAYVGGLMLRTGQLLILLTQPGTWATLERQCTLVDARFDAERAALGVAHHDLTAMLAGSWKFPPALVRAFECAGDPMAAHPFNRLGAVLRLASVIADARDRALPVSEALMQAQGALVEHLRVDLDWLEEHLPDHRLATAGVDDLMH